jgi:dihydrofolate reductase
MGKPVVMGRKTFQSLRKPLDGRDNIVVTRAPGFTAPDGVIVVHSLPAALEAARRCAKARGVDEIMMIGGADIFRLALPFADRLYWTHVEGRPEGDTFFPAFDAHDWHITERQTLPRGDKDEFACTLKIMDRVRATLGKAPESNK